MNASRRTDDAEYRAIVSHSDLATAAGHRRSVLAISYLVFFLSGAAALLYEISWSRQIGLLFGYTVHAAAVVLASFFFGLAVGYTVGGRYARRVQPLVAYGLAEFVAAAWAFVVPLLLSRMETDFTFTWWTSTSPTLQLALRGVVCSLLLLPATVALGMTLPLMAEFLAGDDQSVAGRVSKAYSWNTAGAFVGVVCSTLYLLVEVGVRGSSYLAAGLSATVGSMAWLLAFWTKPKGSPLVGIPPLDRPSATFRQADITRAINRESNKWAGALAAACGFGTLALEVLCTRLFSLVFHNSTYTFGTVVAVFLAALTAGAAAAPKLTERVRPAVLLGWLSLMGAMAIALSLVVFVYTTGLEYFTSGKTFLSYLIGGTLLVTVVVFPPIALLGTLLPLLWQSGDGARGDGWRVGRLTTVNTFAAAAGAIAASFVMLPRLGLWGSFAAVETLFGLVSVLVFVRLGKRLTGVLAVAFTVTATGGLILAGGVWAQPASSKDEIVIRRWESAYGWIDLVNDARTGELKIRQNLHYRLGATGPAAVRERRQAHLPLFLHEQPRNVLFLGQGTGVTAAGALAHAEVERVTIVELVPEVVEAARALAEFNDSVVDNPKVTIEIDDARHFLLRSTQQYDLIVSDLFVPWESHTGYLYTVEHYRIARKRLAPGGLFCQWLPLYQLGARDFQMIADSFASEFPSTTIWWGQLNSQKAIVALVGSNGTLRLDAARVAQRMKDLSSHRDDPLLQSPEHLLGLFAGSWTPNPDGPLNTDEHPRVEFALPVSQADKRLLTGTALQEFYDRVLKDLPEQKLRSDFPSSHTDAAKRRAWQHVLLFGS